MPPEILYAILGFAATLILDRFGVRLPNGPAPAPKPDPAKPDQPGPAPVLPDLSDRPLLSALLRLLPALLSDARSAGASDAARGVRPPGEVRHSE